MMYHNGTKDMKMKKKKRNFRRPSSAWRFFAKLALFLSIGIGVLFAMVMFVFVAGCPPANTSKLEDLARFKLPPSYTNLMADCTGSRGLIERVASARFDMVPNDLDAFAGSLHLKPDFSQIYDGAYDDPLRDFDMPKPDELTSYLYSYVWDGQFLYQEVLIDTSNTESYRVYVSVYFE